MIARMWSGTVRRADAEAYVEYVRETGFDEYAATPGNRGAWLLRRDDGEETEIVTYSLWDDVEAIRAFAGDDIDTAVYYPEDERFLLRRDEKVRHFEIAGHHPDPDPDGGT